MNHFFNIFESGGAELVPSSIMRKFIYKSGRTPSAQGREPALNCPIAEGRERVKGGEAAFLAYRSPKKGLHFAGL